MISFPPIDIRATTAVPLAGLIDSLQWVPGDSTSLDTAAGVVIADHCRQADIPVPPDEAFQGAKWLVPSGSELDYSAPIPSPCLRIDLGGHGTFVLLVGWSDVCGCGTCAGRPSLRVVEVRR